MGSLTITKLWTRGGWVSWHVNDTPAEIYMLLGLQSPQWVWSRPAPLALPSASAPPSVKREGFPETPVPCKSGPHPALNAGPSPRSQAAGGRAAGGSRGRPLPSRPGRVWPEGASASRHRVTTREHTGVGPMASCQHRQPGGAVEGLWAGSAAASLSASVLTELQYPDSTSACGCVLGLAISGNY